VLAFKCAPHGGEGEGRRRQMAVPYVGSRSLLLDIFEDYVVGILMAVNWKVKTWA
jgi:hypothetical protein